MKHTSLWILMAGSLAAGVLMVFGGSAAGSDMGQLAAGYLADFVVMDRDLFAIDPEAIGKTRVLRTIVGGRQRFG